MADKEARAFGGGVREEVREQRLYPLVFRMNEEIKSLSLQIRALRSLIERNDENDTESRSR